MRRLMFRPMIVVALLAATASMAAEGGSMAADRGWVTSNSSRYHWNSSGIYSVTQENINAGGEYGYYDAGYAGGSFRLEWDIKMLSNEYASDVRFGVFDSDLHTDNGSYAAVMFTKADAGNAVYLQRHDVTSSGQVTESGEFSHGVWYHVVMEYDAGASTLLATVTERDAGTELLSLNMSDVGPFAADMGLVGTSNVRDGNYQVPGAKSQGEIDNVRFASGFLLTGFATTPHPLELSLEQNAPNPFNPSTTISFVVTRESPVSITVYNAAGQLVRALVDGRLNTGRHHVVWDGLDAFGRQASSGVYFYRLTSAGGTMTRKMVLLR